MNRSFLITEEERKRIIGMHQTATKKHYIFEKNEVAKNSRLLLESDRDDVVKGFLEALGDQFVKNIDEVRLGEMLEKNPVFVKIPKEDVGFEDFTCRSIDDLIAAAEKTKAVTKGSSIEEGIKLVVKYNPQLRVEFDRALSRINEIRKKMGLTPYIIFENIINEAYYGIIQEEDDICEIICKRKMAMYGSNGDVVKMIQHLLMANGFNPKYEGGGMNKGCSTDYRKCDGLFRQHTRDTVKEFQKKYGLIVDGKVGYQTWEKMCEVIKFTSSVTKDMFCKDCDCDDQDDDQDDDRKDDDQDDVIKDDDLDQFDCDEIKYCMQKYLFGVTAPDYVGFMECIMNNAKKDKDKIDYEYINKDGNVKQCYWNVSGKNVFKCPEFVNCMPGPGQDFKYCDSIAIKMCIKTGCTKKAV